jgi:S-adenosylmethionine hydrolase
MIRPVVTLLSDYGLDDEFVGVCHGVIVGICPAAQIIDVTHGIAPQDVLGGALRLVAALPYLPVGVHVAVVDPGVGSDRRAVALRCDDGRFLVGPDNGLLWPALTGAGGLREGVEISRSPASVKPVSATFHGRDIFAPVAAHLAAGRSLAEVGGPLDPTTLVRLDVPSPRVLDGRLALTILLVDRFGNLQLNSHAQEGREMGLRPGCGIEIGEHPARYARTFADAAPGELIVYEDSTGHLAVAVNRGSAASLLNVQTGDELVLGPVRARNP